MGNTPLPYKQPLPDWAFKFASVLSLPALLWAFSLNAERATNEVRLKQLESRIERCESDSSQLMQLVQEQKESMAEMRATLNFIREEVLQIRQQMAADRSNGQNNAR